MEAKETPKTENQNPSFFADRVADSLLAEKPGVLLKTLVIFPNQRAARAIRSSLIEKAKGRALFLPRMLSLDQWIDALLPGRRARKLELLSLLFQRFQEEKKSRETLGSFIGLGEILLEDYDAIIRSGNRPSLVFGEIKRWGETGFSFQDAFDEEQKELLRRFSAVFDERNEGIRGRFLDLWRTLPGIFEKFESDLREKKLYSPGLAYREVALLPDLAARLAPFEHLRIVGFGHLSQVEIDLFDAAGRWMETDWVWDFQADWQARPFHPVARLMSRLERHASLVPSLKRWTQTFSPPLPRMVEIQCFGPAGLCHTLAEIGQNWGAETAVILGDVNLSLPLVEATRDFDPAPNLSAGLPLGNFRWVSWMANLVGVLAETGSLPAERIRDLVRQSGEGLPVDTWLHHVNERLHPTGFVKRDQLAAILPEWPFLRADKPASFLALFLDFLADFSLPEPENEWIGSVVERIRAMCEDLLRDWAELPEKEADWQSLRQLVLSSAPGYALSLKGDPEQGIQVIGLYESRVLNFERVVFMPAQEGVFPARDARESFIPESIRRAFRIHGEEEKQHDIYHQLYRLLSPAREVYFLVDALSEVNRSPLIDQFEFGGKSAPEKQTAVAGKGFFKPKPIQYAKSEAFFQALAAFRENGGLHPFSPNSLHHLLVCDLRFVFAKILGLEEPESPDALEMAAVDFGNWIHETLQRLLVAHSGPDGILDKEAVDRMRKNREDMAKKVWENLPGKISPKNLEEYPIEWALAAHMEEQFFLGIEKEGNLRFRDQEWKFPAVPFEENGRTWWISGRVDLILESPSAYWILDLKTGGLKVGTKMKVWTRNGFAEHNLRETKDLFQILLYAWMARKTERFRGKPVRTALWYLADPESNWLDPLEGKDEALISGEIFPELERFMAQHLTQLADPQHDIRQTDNLKACGLCSFAPICQR